MPATVASVAGRDVLRHAVANEVVGTMRAHAPRERRPGARLSERRRLLLSVVGLVAIYVLVVALGDTRAWSGSDAGGKVATVRVMAESGSWSPDVDYWAEQWDPDGAFHPLIYTRHVGEKWVQITSLPFIYLGVPLWHMGGAGALLVLPIAGGVLAAVGAKRLARHLGAPSGWFAFWLVGLGTPALFYAGDFWEHSMGMAVGIFAVDAGLRARDRRGAALAGALFGLGATLRTEMFVYAAVFALVSLLVAEERRKWLSRRLLGVAAAGAAIAVLALNTLAERAAIGRSVRGSIVATNVEDAGSELSARVDDALTTTFALFSDDSADAIVAGVLLTLVLAFLAWRARRQRALGTIDKALAGIGGALLLARAGSGLGFVPGMFAAAVAAPTGPSLAATTRSRVIVAVAMFALPVVWFVQHRGQLVAQWGGRYLLISGALLTVVAAAELERGGAVAVRRIVAGFAIAVTAFGALWHIDRTAGVARAADQLVDVPRDVVVVSALAHLGREAGAFYGDRRWLSSIGGGELRKAVAVARRSGARRVDVVVLAGSEEDTQFVGFEARSVRAIDFLGFELHARRYVREQGR